MKRETHRWNKNQRIQLKFMAAVMGLLLLVFLLIVHIFVALSQTEPPKEEAPIPVTEYWKNVWIKENAEGQLLLYHEGEERWYPYEESLQAGTESNLREQLADVTEEMFYRAVNRAQPSLIRTEADELTYSLHVMIRYEIEKQLMEGTLSVRDVPAVWNDLYEAYLGIRPANDKEGCLQDSHWSGGMFGYFPSYALGSAYGAQMLDRMEREVPALWESVASGDLSPVTSWLHDRIHRYSALYTPKEIIDNVCGEFAPSYYVRYLTEKYTDLYHL